MGDDTIFAIEDPITEELLFCTVMGGAGEMFGLAVNIGEVGYRALMSTMQGGNSPMGLVTQQR
ncbi:hypothetical protein AOA62_01585, partial [Pseudomonas sp. 2995-3]